MNRKFLYSLACVVPAVLYALTASRTLPWGDGAEFYVAVRNLGIPHPSGYPLFILLGRVSYLISKSPLLLNLLAGLITVMATYFLYRIILHLTKAPFVSLAFALLFAVGRPVWQQSVAAEVYTLNVLLFIILLYLVLKAQKKMRFVIPAFFIAGLALTNHLTSLFYIVPCCLYLVITNPRAIRFAPIALLPLLLYLYFPIRSEVNPVPDLFDPETPGRLIAYVSGRSFLYRTFSVARPSLGTDMLQFLKSWWFQCFVLLPLGFYGLFHVRNKRFFILLIVVSVLVCGYTLLYHIPDKQGYFLPFYAIWSIFIALAAVKLIPRKFRPLLLAIPVLSAVVNYRSCDLSRETSLNDLGRAIFVALPDKSVFISDDYFVYYDMVNRVQSSSKQIVPVVQFYLRMDWYINQLKDRYPELVIPDTIDRLIADCDAALRNTGSSHYGDISKQCCLDVQYEIVQANMDSQPVCYFMYDDGHWPRWLRNHYLQYHGLYYRYHRDSVPPVIFDLDVPPPDTYRTTALMHEDNMYVAKKLAAAYNRRGIYRFQNADANGAINDMYTALRYYPDYHQVHANLGLTFLSIGDTTSALNQWKTYLQDAPSGPRYDQIQRWYNALRNIY